MGALVTSGCDAKLWNAAMAAEAILTVEKEFAICMEQHLHQTEWGIHPVIPTSPVIG